MTDGGRRPLPRQEAPDVVPTEDEVRHAVKELGVGIKVVLGAKKWRATAMANLLAQSVGAQGEHEVLGE